MEATYCHRCGARIKNVFLYQGNKYGSECIEKIPFNESVVRDNIDMVALVQALIYAKMKSANLDEIINRIPVIGTRIDVHQGFYQVVTGYGSKRIHPARKNKEFAIRVNNVYPTAPQYNNAGWLTIAKLLKEEKIKGG